MQVEIRPSVVRFAGEYEFLSNFYPATVAMYGLDYSTVEHAYQAAKVAVLPDSRRERELVRKAMTPALAKRMGQKVTLRPDWDTFKFEAMEMLLRRKFDRDDHPELARRLAETGALVLVEGNTWGDQTWGAIMCKTVRPGDEVWSEFGDDGRALIGQNHLGRLLMKIREELVG